jgi:hypothetical protein
LFGPAQQNALPAVQSKINIIPVGQASFVPGTTNGAYLGLPASISSGTIPFAITETVQSNLATLLGFYNVNFAGEIRMNLPAPPTSTATWTTANTSITAVSNSAGVTVKTTPAAGVTSSTFGVSVAGTYPQNILIQILGQQTF